MGVHGGGARDGKAYRESLAANQPEVYLGGRRVADVTAEPIFPGRSAPSPSSTTCSATRRYRDVMTYSSPTTGQR